MKVKIRFASSKSLISWVIRIFTWSRVSHVDYVFEYPNGGREYYGALPSTGVDYNDVEFDYVEYYEVDVPKPEELEKFLLEQRHKSYDWMAILSIVFRNQWQRDKKWFCSELIAAALEAGGIRIFNERHYRITPRDLYINVKFKKIE